MNLLAYSLLFYLCTPFIIFRLLWRARRAPAYRKRWGERFGYIRPLPRNKPIIWIHSVSVGETIACTPLVKALMQAHPGYRILITTMTPTASEQVKAIYGSTMDHLYIPYDLPGAQARFISCVKPKIAIIMETELWPNSIAACNKRNIPIIIANARLSERSARGYKKVGRLIYNLLNQVTVVACQNNKDGERFVQLGLPKEKLQVIGSVKFDIEVTEEINQSVKDLRLLWDSGFGRKAEILIAGSTHEGEEQAIIDAFIQLKKRHHNLLLVLVPRHPERFDAVYKLSCNHDLNTIRHSNNKIISPNTDVILGDTMGEMMKLYAASNIAFVGGSLIDSGGHNVLEPAIHGIPVISGPYFYNFQEIISSLKSAGGLVVVDSSQALVIEVEKLLNNKSYYENTGKQAKFFVESNRGALKRLQYIISEQIALKK